MKQKLGVVIVAHTHWDRAWYVPFEEFHSRLVYLFDKLINLFDEDPHFTKFVLDGQTIVLEDYFQIRPEKKEIVGELVKSGKLVIGPWYVLPDEFLVSPESLIRNLQIGMDTAESLGKVMNVGYIPDPFGHVGQLPQILRGFGLKSAIFTRGISPELARNIGVEFQWTAPNKESVLGIWQRTWYGNAALLGYDINWGDPSLFEFSLKKAVKQFEEAVSDLQPFVIAPWVLLCNGIDHSEAQLELTLILSEVRRLHPEWKIVQGDFDDYVNKIDYHLKSTRLPVIKGELSYNAGDLLRGVNSSRIYLKQTNHRAETMLERYAEPLSTFAWLTGKEEDQRSFLDYAWRELIKNHPHDDICGCSIDKVHEEMLTRYDHSLQASSIVTRDSLYFIAGRINATSYEGLPLMIYNPTYCERTDLVETPLHLTKDDQLQNSFRLINEKGEDISYTITDKQSMQWWEPVRHFDTQTVNISFLAENVPPLGYKMFSILPGKPKQCKTKIKANNCKLENDLLSVTISRNGSINILDKEFGTSYKSFNLLEDVADTGDEYNFSPLPNGIPTLSRNVTADSHLLWATQDSAALQITFVFPLPASLTVNRKKRTVRKISCHCSVTVKMKKNSRFLALTTTLVNRVRDHRLRVLFPTGISTSRIQVESCFDVVERKIPVTSPSAQLPLYPTDHQRTFVDISDGQKGIAIINQGLPEYEAVHTTNGITLALTLIRSVGWLSRPDLQTRPGDAGPSLPAPGAQCLGKHIFKYAILPHQGDWITGKVLKEAHQFQAPLKVTRLDMKRGIGKQAPDAIPSVPEDISYRKLPSNTSFIKLEPEELVLSALYRSRNMNGFVIRLYNPTEHSLKGKITLPFSIKQWFETDLRENRLGSIQKMNKKHSLSFNVSPKKIITLLVKPANVPIKTFL